MSTSDNSSKLSRRAFLKATSMGAAAVAGSSILSACAPKQATPAAVEPPSTGGRVYSWETPPTPIPAADIKETVTTDVVVVGAGTSGMVAALSAREAGAKVILIEKHTMFRYGGGYNAALGSRLQKSLGIELDKNDVVLSLMRFDECKPDQCLLRLWADNSGKIMDWLMDMAEAEGIKTAIRTWPQPDGYDLKKEFYPVYPAGHSIGEGDNQSPLLKVLEKNALAKGVDIRYSTPGVQLVSDGGRVTGIIAKNKDGNYVQLKANKGVILCSGDYGNDPEMCEKYLPPAVAKKAADANIYTSYMKNEEQPKGKLNTGDGQKMALWAGAQMDDTPNCAMGWATPVLPGTFLRVNSRGERYENEDTEYMYSFSGVLRQPGSIAWQVLDSKYVADSQHMQSFTGAGLIVATEAMAGYIESSCLKADTIEELAKKMSVPVETLKATIARRNELTATSEDVDFGLASNRLSTIEKPPFYAYKLTPTFSVSLGGVKVNTNLQVKDANGDPIPGLYAAGNTVGNRYGLYYNSAVPGLSNGLAWTHGYLAGKNAAAETA
jgi:fumarate reductase flavoprotein subunit